MYTYYNQVLKMTALTVYHEENQDSFDISSSTKIGEPWLTLNVCHRSSKLPWLPVAAVNHQDLIVVYIRGVAKANRSICIISARGQIPQWVQDKALVGGPWGEAPWKLLDFTRFTYFRTCLHECVLFCLQFTICVLRSGHMCRRWI